MQLKQKFLLATCTALLVGCAGASSQQGGVTFTAQPAPPPYDARTETSEDRGTLELAIAAQPVVAAPAIIAPPPRSSRAITPLPGVLTAGDIDDTLNVAAFTHYQRGASNALHLPRARLGNPILAQLRDPNGAPAPGVRITLRKPGAADPFYDGYSGVDGAIAIFPAVHGQSRLRNVELRAFPETDAAPLVTQLTTGTTRQTVDLPFTNTWSPDFLDLVFAVDTTGSMSDELDWLAQEIGHITRNAKSATPNVDIRFGLVVYKAPADSYVIRSYGFTRDVAEFSRWIGAEHAFGGAGGPEVVADALHAAVGLDWRRGKGERLLFQIGDERPRADKTQTYYNAAQNAAAQGIQIFGLAASGVDDELEFLMRQGSAMTQGRYIFLTDDSDVGLGHAEPTVSCYRVTRLNDLMVRVLRSELGGHRIEAAPSDVLRETGSYHNGRCRN